MFCSHGRAMVEVSLVPMKRETPARSYWRAHPHNDRCEHQPRDADAGVIGAIGEGLRAGAELSGIEIPGGEIVGTSLGACNGDETVKQSIVSAVLRSSPLPAPPDPALFERNLEIVFVPEDDAT